MMLLEEFGETTNVYRMRGIVERNHRKIMSLPDDCEEEKRTYSKLRDEFYEETRILRPSKS